MASQAQSLYPLVMSQHCLRVLIIHKYEFMSYYSQRPRKDSLAYMNLDLILGHQLKQPFKFPK